MTRIVICKIGKAFGFVSSGFGVMIVAGGAFAAMPISIAVGAGLIALGLIISYLIGKNGEKKITTNSVGGA